MKVPFGTSGARGKVEELTDAVCAELTLRFLSAIGGDVGGGALRLGRDLRPSSARIAKACAAAARSQGVEVTDYGVVPTPALARQSIEAGAPAIMVTGSHIPFDRNGLKFYRPEGEITKADEEAIRAAEVKVPEITVGQSLPESRRAREEYVRRYVGWFPKGVLAGARVGLYQHSAAGRDINREVLEGLGAEVVELRRTDEFVPVDTEAVSDEDRARARRWAKEYGLDAIISTDGDGDRPLVADERGEWLRGDVLGLLCARELDVEALAVPVSCNTAIEDSGAFSEVARTRIGSPYVLAGIEELSARYSRVAGFEANGGFLLGSPVVADGRRLDALPTRDALLPALTVLVGAAQRGVSLSAVRDELPQRCTASDRLQEFPTETSHRLLAEWRDDIGSMERILDQEDHVVDTDETDGLRATLGNGDIVHLRPSGNAPELRCYAESSTQERAERLVRRTLERLADS